MLESRPNRGVVLLVDDTPANLDVLVSALSQAHFQVLVATSGEQALARSRSGRPNLILLDVMMPGIDGFETCRRLKGEPETADIPVIFMTALTDAADKVRGFQAGGVDYVTKPIHHEEVLARVTTHLQLRNLQLEQARINEKLEHRVAERTAELESALREVERLKSELERENTWLREELDSHQPYGDIIGRTPAIRKVIEQIELVAPTEASVLILGESGTGKELVAREVHRHSARARAPIVKVNCASVPRELYESEFFGHVKGAFTGAVRDRQGRFAAADGGTLFLDEVGEIPLEMQAKLLRVLQEGTYERVGDERTRSVDVRIIAATNRNLEKEVAAGRFREDLYYRLKVFPITVPSLRERRDDITLLAQYFIEKIARRMGLPEVPRVSEADIKRIRSHDWPGNVRELENAIERAVIMSRTSGTLRFDLEGTGQPPSAPGNGSHGRAGATLEVSAMHTWGLEAGGEPGGDDDGERPLLTEDEINELIRENTRQALELTGWRVRGEGGAAELLGIKPTTLFSRMKRMGLDRAGD